MGDPDPSNVLAFPVASPAPEVPVALADEVVRRRLLEPLARRFDVPVTTVVAGAGFGKSTLIGQAVRANRVRPRGVDLVHSCVPADSTLPALADGLGRALGVSVGARDPDRTAARVADALAARAPTAVCLVLDDVHHLGEETPAAAALAALVRSLPRNGHLLLVSRAEVPVPLMRLRAADEVVELTEADLGFTGAEMDELAHSHGVAIDPARTGGWPALVRLAVTLGHAAGPEYLWEELVEGADPELRRVLAVLVLAGGGDAGLVGEVLDTTVDLAALVGPVPLVELDPRTGRAVPHALWSEVVDRLVPRSEADELASAVVEQLVAHRAFDRAVGVALARADRDLVSRTLVRALASGVHIFDLPTAQRWLDDLPADARSTPGGALLAAVVERNLGRSAPEEVADRLARVGEELRAAGDVSGEAVALSEIAAVAFHSQDADRLAAIDDRLAELRASQPTRLAGVSSYVAALRADTEGDPAAAIAALDEIAPPSGGVQTLIDHWRSTLLVLVGRASDAVAYGAAVAGRSRYAPVRMSEAVARWFAGDPTPVLAIGLPGPDTTPGGPLLRRDQFLAAVHVAMFTASARLDRATSDPDALAAGAGADGRDQAFVALCAAADQVLAGDEAAAAATVADLLERHPLDDGRARSELRRFLPYGYVLHEGLRAATDDEAAVGALGPDHVVQQRLARLFVDLRAGRATDPAVDWSAWPEPGRIVSSFPLPWTAELAARGAAAGRAEADELTAYLLDVVGEPGREALRRVADGSLAADRGGALAGAATGLLARVPTPPRARTELRFIGPPELWRDGELVDAPEWRRRRVRELIGLLALRGTVRREEVMALLWPDSDEERAARSLRTTLTHARRILEPDRERGDAPFHLRQRGQDLELTGRSRLTVDLWEVEDRLAAARETEATAHTRRTVAHLLAAVDLWRGEPLVDLRDTEGLEGPIRLLTEDLVAAALRAAELLLAGEVDRDRVRDLTEQVLAADPYNEDALRLGVVEALERGDAVAARRAAARCRAVLSELGVAPGEATALVLARAET